MCSVLTICFQLDKIHDLIETASSTASTTRVTANPGIRIVYEYQLRDLCPWVIVVLVRFFKTNYMDRSVPACVCL